MKSWITILAGLFLLPLLSVGFAPSAEAQKVDKKYFEMAEYGFRFKPLRDYNRIPPQDREKAGGIIGKMEGPVLRLNIKGSGVYDFNPDINVYRFTEKRKRTIGDIEDGASVTFEYERVDLAEFLDDTYRGVNKDKVLVDEVVKIDKTLNARHRQWQGSVRGDTGYFTVDAWTFEVGDAEVHVVYTVPDKYKKKWLKAFVKSAKTFELIEVKKAPTLNDEMTYEERLAYYDNDERDQGGWRAYPTPSKRYIVKYDGDDDKFIDKVIARLEASRNLFEVDFPPSKPIEHVSVVRICDTEEVFHSYGGTGGGVAGWFSPATTELVLYDNQQVDRNMTYAVMTHEAFHQYCHFLFNESEAHRWFDEGHGDYYGGGQMGRSARTPLKITPKMPAGLGRIGEIRQMIREATYVPLEEHLNYNHGQWQSQGPTNVSCYAQSWSVIFMLRQGALGKVPSKLWKKEYANIIPNYIRVLSAEYKIAKDEAREELRKRKEREAKRKKDREEREKRKRDRRKKPKAGPDEPEKEDTPEEKGKDKPEDETFVIDLSGEEIHIDRERKKQIWKKAMEASWGQIDIDEFEALWVTYVAKHI